jgi:hypothetical protein
MLFLCLKHSSLGGFWQASPLLRLSLMSKQLVGPECYKPENGPKVPKALEGAWHRGRRRTFEENCWGHGSTTY